MATQTSNLGLTKPAYSETADIADINNNMDKVDAAVNGVQNGMAILANGNVHSAVTSGQYVYVRNHGTLAEGLYTATTNISTNATLSTSNLTAVPNNGALNTLRDDVTSLNSKLAFQSGTFEYSDGYSADMFKIYKSGNVVTVCFDSLKVNATGSNLVGRIPAGFRPPTSFVGTAFVRNGNTFLFIIGTEGNLRLYDVQNTSQIFYGHVSYCVNA